MAPSALSGKAPTDKSSPQPNDEQDRDEVVHTAEHAGEVVVTVLGCLGNGATDRRAGQTADTSNGKNGTHSVADFVHGRDAHDKDGTEADTSARTNAEEDGKYNGCGVATTRKPQSKNDDHVEKDHEDHDVEAPVLVSQHVGHSSTDKAGVLALDFH